jgi:VanZ family protein
MTLAGYLSVLGEKRAAAKTAALGVVVILGLEASQLAIESRMAGAWDALVGVVGILAGVAIWASATVIVWPRLWFAVIVSGTIAAAAMQMLSPFTLASDYRPMSWFPFIGYYTRTTFETLSHVIELALIYFPMGFWIGSSGVERRRAMWMAAGAALVIAVPIELLQGYISDRYPDISDIALSLAGAATGAALGHWAMRREDLA